MTDILQHPPTQLETDEKAALEVACSLLTTGMKEKLDKIPSEYLGMDLSQLEEMANPTQLDRMLRKSFWKEVERVTSKLGEVLRPVNIYTGICTRENFHYVLLNPAKFAFLLNPPRSYEKNITHIMEQGVEKLITVLDAKLVYSNGHMDAKATKTLLDVVAYFESRLKGGIKQKVDINSKSQSLDVTVNVSSGNIKELDQKLAKMREDLAIYDAQDLVHTLPEKIKDVEETDSES